MVQKLQQELKKALAEIGDIAPWWSRKDKAYVFEHPLYPFVDYVAKTKEEVIEKYPLVLKAFIADRLAGEVSPKLERITSGRGGNRPGSGRPRGTKKPPTKMIRLPIEIAAWLKADPANLDKIQQFIEDLKRHSA